MDKNVYLDLHAMFSYVHFEYSIVITVLAIMSIFWDIGHFVKTCVSVSFGRIFQRKYNITETTVQYGICTTRDVDLICSHMNNARCLRAIDFARNHFYSLTGIHDKIGPHKILVGASTVRYRKPLQLFSVYRIESKMLCWHQQKIYTEHKIITTKDNFVRAIVLSRAHAVDVDLPTIMSGVPKADTLTTFPEEVAQWERCLETLSTKLR